MMAACVAVTLEGRVARRGFGRAADKSKIPIDAL